MSKKTDNNLSVPSHAPIQKADEKKTFSWTKAVVVTIFAVILLLLSFRAGVWVGTGVGINTADLEVRKEVVNCESQGGLLRMVFYNGVLNAKCENPKDVCINGG